MIEIVLKNNPSSRKVEIDNIYDYKQIPQTEMTIAVLSLEAIVYDMLSKNEKNRKYERKRKRKVSNSE